ncbi:serine/threonine protein kinase [Streptomyces sp. A7024]|uniref:Serine/threonine protein kinase n=1 Tax=Streptomyces coryli TaxID=1128680 RepID=A0A6G4U556_9ACTN|nr:serine/threonine-protein kinase [Streptomyces coryli]NGN67365.1 serine/threonine protein kinase [Streptomyces coryli]
MTGVGLRALGDNDPRRLGDFRLLWRLATGGMGRLYLARADEPGSPLVAVKTLLAEGMVSDRDRERFAREVELARRVDSAWTARVLAADPAAERPWMAIEYIPAPALSDLVGAAGKLPAWAVPWLGAGTLQALLALHDKGVIHRDVKPQNILLPMTGPLLIDFGISHAVDITRTSFTLGTFGFMSPEQARGEPSTTASDVFSVGATLFYMAVGRPPYPEPDGPMRALAQVQRGEVDLAGLPSALEPLIRPCLAVEPADRPDPAELLVRMVREVDGGAGRRRGQRWLPPSWTELIEAYEAYGRVLGGEGATLGADGDRTQPVPPPAPTLVDTRERQARREREEAARETRLRREEEIRRLAAAAEQARHERERAEEAERRAREERESAERERAAAEEARRRANAAAGSGSGAGSASASAAGAASAASGSGSGSSSSSGSGSSSNSGGGLLVLLVVIGIVLAIWQPWEAANSGDSTAGSAGSTPTASALTSGGSSGTSADGGTTSGSGAGAADDDTPAAADDDDDEPEQPDPTTSSPEPDPTEQAFKRVSSGDCLKVYDTGQAGRYNVRWSAAAPPPSVSCAGSDAYVQVTGVTAGSCPSGVDKSSWSYRSPSSGDTTRLCMTRIYRAGYCLLARQSGDSISLGGLTGVSCGASQVPSAYNQVMHITGVYRAPAGANASNCRRTANDATRYWSWTVNGGNTLLCTKIYGA